MASISTCSEAPGRSAGTGALGALAAGASVHDNELSGRRAELRSVMLSEAGQGPAKTLTRENADHLDAILPSHVRADVTTMNHLQPGRWAPRPASWPV